MKLTVVRAIPIVLAIALAAFFVSGVHRFKNAHHGLDAVIGEAAWLGFLIAALALIVLTAVALHRRRRAAIVSACVCALALAAVAGASTATVAPSVKVTLGSHGPTIAGPTHGIQARSGSPPPRGSPIRSSSFCTSCPATAMRSSRPTAPSRRVTPQPPAPHSHGSSPTRSSTAA